MDPKTTSSPTSSPSTSSSTLPPLTPNPNPSFPIQNPTTFVQADTQNFKQIVQMLTGSTQPASKSSANHIPPYSKPNKNKLYERRKSMKNLSMITTLNSNKPLPSDYNSYSPSVLKFPNLVLSPVTPLIADPFINHAAEDQAIKNKGYYLHHSPRDGEPPKLLPLFPLTSPRLSEKQN